MKKLLGRLNQGLRIALGDELSLFFGYALIVFRPGAVPPQHPGSSAIPARAVPDDWTDAEYQLYIEEARLDAAGQQDDKRDIRTRAQILLTTALLLGGLIVTSYEGKDDVCTCGKLAYLASAILATLATLSAGGIITAKSAIGAPNLMALPYTKRAACISEWPMSTRTPARQG